MSKVLRKAVEVAGSQTALAELIGKTQGHISKWLERGNIPPESVILVERATGIPRHELRPDLYPIEELIHRPDQMQITTQAAEGLQRRRFTVAEIEAAVRLGIISEDERFELIGGDLVPMSPKGSRHESYKASLMDFWMHFPRKAHKIIQETTFKLDDSTFLEPDFVFYDAKFKVPDIAPANTLLAVEVSDSTLTFDKGRKARIYSNHGVKLLWVIDVNALETHIFEQPGIDGYRITRVIRPDEFLIPDFAPELALKLGELKLI